MSGEDLRIWGLYVVFGLQLIVQFVGWLRRKTVATPEQLGAVRGEMQSMRTDLEEKIRIERGRVHEANHAIELIRSDIRHLPTHEDVDSIRESMSELSRAMAAMGERVTSLDRSVTNIDEATTRIESTLLNMKSL